MLRKSLATALVAVFSFAAGVFGVYRGDINFDYIRRVLHYNPLLANYNRINETTVLETNQLTLDVETFSVSALEKSFASGGGAIAERGDELLIMSRTGHLYSFRNDQVTTLRAVLDNNNDAYENYARSQGYSPAPGSNVGYAGLGMRNHDLLLLHDGTLLASQTYWQTDKKCAVVRVMRLNNDQWDEVAKTSPCIGLSDKKGKPFAGHQAGGRMIEFAPGKILLTTGDFKQDGSNRVAIIDEPGVQYSKTLLVDLATGNVEVFSRGHRNPQGLLRDDKGNIWSTEHGPVGGDELNVIRQGADYGWPRATLGRDCIECDWQQNGRQAGFEQPVYAWVPSIGPSQLIQVNSFAPSWDGDLLVASMKAETLHRLRIQDGRVQFDEPVVIGDRIRDMIQLANHKIALWTDSGRLIFLSKRNQPTPSEEIIAKFPDAVRTVASECRTCHSFDPGKTPVGLVGLWGIVGSEKASTLFPGYSSALKNTGGQWTAESLDQFLADPQSTVPGTSMMYPGIKDAKTRAELVRFLAELR